MIHTPDFYCISQSATPESPGFLHRKPARSFRIMANTQTGPQADLPIEILQALSQNSPILSSEAFPSYKSTEVKGALDRLASRSMVTYDTIEREEPLLEPEAVGIAANGSHEARVFEALRKALEGLTVSELEAAVGDKNVVKVGQGKAFKSKWIAKGKEGRLVASVSRTSAVRLAAQTLTNQYRPIR